VWRFPTPNVFEQVPLTPQKALISKFPSVRIHLSEALAKPIMQSSEISITI